MLSTVIACLVAGLLLGTLAGWLSALKPEPLRFFAKHPWQVFWLGSVLSAASLLGTSPEVRSEYSSTLGRAWHQAILAVEMPALFFGCALVALGAVHGLSVTWLRSTRKATVLILVWLALTAYQAFHEITGVAPPHAPDPPWTIPALPLLMSWPLAAWISFKVGGREQHTYIAKPVEGIDDGPGTEHASAGLMGILEDQLVTKAPIRIPLNAKKWVVRWWPWITSVVLLIVVPPLPIELSLLSFGVSFGSAGASTRFGYLEDVLVFQLTLTVISLPGLFARKTWGWTPAFYARMGGLIVGLIGATIVDRAIGAATVIFYVLVQLSELWMLFQVRALYTR